VKQRKSLLVFFQGHPEYERNTLLLEYRRDVGRYLRRERDMYPAMPEGYFDRDTADVLTQLRQRLSLTGTMSCSHDFPTAQAEKGAVNTWHGGSAGLRKLAAYLCEQKERRLKNRRYAKHTHNTRKTDLTLSFAESRRD